MEDSIFIAPKEAFEKVRAILQKGELVRGTEDFLHVEVLMFGLADERTPMVHFKGKDYVILATALSADDASLVVIYQAQYGEYEAWVRGIEEFFSMKTITSLEGEGDIVVPRFKVKE